MKLRYLVKGLPGHPLHPPLTDVTIGTYTLATALGCASVIGVSHIQAAHGWWLALVAGLCFTVPTAFTGLVEWLSMERGTALWRTATTHLLVMVTATVIFLIACILGHSGYKVGAVDTAPFILTLVAFATMAVGGWFGGTIVFVYGMRVLNLVTEPAKRAFAPVPKPEKELAEK
jgi:uncharacterized membrane protein